MSGEITVFTNCCKVLMTVQLFRHCYNYLQPGQFVKHCCIFTTKLFIAMQNENKPVIGLSCGDVNGIGLEIIIKTVSDSRLLEICTPVIFANNKVLNFYRKAIPEINFNFSN